MNRNNALKKLVLAALFVALDPIVQEDIISRMEYAL